MPLATDRIVIQVSPEQKAGFLSKANQFGLTLSDFMRRAAESFSETPDDRELEALLAQVEKTTGEANAALDSSLRKVSESERRIEALETGRASAPKAKKRAA